MFHNSRNFRITGSIFNNLSQYNGPVHLPNHKTSMEILLEAASPGAFHNSGERSDPPKCYPNTRVDVLSKVMDWIIGKFGWEEYIMWLYGPAGAGKSAIAQTIAEMCHQDRKLLASFFFSRSDPKRNSVKTLAASLAYQVAVNIPQARSLIEGAVTNDPAIFQRSFRAQFDSLILEPLMQLYKTRWFPWFPVSPPNGPYLIIIDGLDECNDTNDQRHILDTISDALSRSRDRVHLIILFSSRTEQELSLAFAAPAFESVTAHISLDDAYQPASDIRRYFNGCFSEIKQTHLQKQSIPAAWPSDADVSSLVSKSSGQFIYAATVIRYISSSRYNPTSSLEIILGLHPVIPVRKDVPFAELDALYSDILSRVEDIDSTLRLLAAIILSNCKDKSTKFMERIMLLDEGDATRLLVDLSSIIMVDKESKIRVLHASFGDFLLDQARSKEYHINPTAMFTELSRIALFRITQFGLLHISEYTENDVLFAYWWFEEAEDFLFRANPTDELREMVLKTPFIQCIYSLVSEGRYAPWCDTLVDMLLMGLKTSGFSNTDELYLYHRGVWDQILHERLSMINSDTMVDAIIVSAFIKNRDIYIDAENLADILVSVIKLQMDDSHWLLNTFLQYIGPFMNPGYQELLLEFFADPIRAGKYMIDGTKFATLTKILLGFLVQSCNDKRYERLIELEASAILGTVEEIIPQAGPYPELVEMLNNSALIFPDQCRSHRCYLRAYEYKDLTRDFQVTVRTLANYLMQVCGSVPPGFRITVRGRNGEEDTSYYYDADSDDE
ncbi:hypothetical protein GALMADRAFT_162161 [Galerina marginata CBS 339.88]|uniref:Nephrocystin 3-like N-terminal domain-containing protein n=1 Tax=Galerina marginata (strain CBS 339.88) TaxID=685588 RepID=A0A067SEU0_GALM3|nr:hypothetical protein GALMADRAFT_162161 [Galerina marginata CBS 339.88]